MEAHERKNMLAAAAAAESTRNMETYHAGHPTIAAPFVLEEGPRDDGSPATICFTGHLDQDEQLLAVVGEWQRAYAHHVLRPPMEWLSADPDPGDPPPSDGDGR